MPTSPGESVVAGTDAVPPIARIASDVDDDGDAKPAASSAKVKVKVKAKAKARAKAHGRTRRPFGDMVLHAPQTLRALVRTDELWLVALSAFIGCGAGVLVWLMTETTQLIHQLLFGISSGQRLSAMVELNPIVTVVVPALGGLALGMVGLGIMRWWPRPAVDPIEANALYGGRMSLGDSLLVVLQTVMSNGVGASVGLEAGYTQIGSAIASRFGRSFRVRRNDLRVLVGCGAAAAIGGAFNAPLTGAFYAFELVIGTYSLATLAPVAVASMVAVGVVHGLSNDPFELDLLIPPRIDPVDYVPLLVLGVLCALIGIAIMRGVTLTESLFRRSGVPGWLRPAIGGAAIGTLALVSPMVLSSGHGALTPLITTPYALPHIGLLIVLKACASAISIGSGFRGGLFFASLFLGAMVGKFFAGAFALVSAANALSPVVCALVAMSSMAVAIVGGPLTMGFLALESTGSLPLTIAVLAACVVSSLTVRRTFGYSFATWRFHLRGEAIRSAVDIGWMRSLTVGRMMRREVRTVRASTSLATFRRDFPLGATQRVVALGDDDAYAGIVLTPEAHAQDAGARTVADVVHYADAMLLPQMSVKEAIGMFESAESDALAVVDAADTRRVIGLLTEHYALRRYSEELDRRRRELSGE
jgi:CIC family chloride channel protein